MKVNSADVAAAKRSRLLPSIKPCANCLLLGMFLRGRGSPISCLRSSPNRDQLAAKSEENHSTLRTIPHPAESSKFAPAACGDCGSTGFRALIDKYLWMCDQDRY